MDQTPLPDMPTGPEPVWSGSVYATSDPWSPQLRIVTYTDGTLTLQLFDAKGSPYNAPPMPMLRERWETLIRYVEEGWHHAARNDRP